MLSLGLLKLGLLSFVDATSVFGNFDFSNIFYASNWSVFRVIFLVYFVFTLLLAVLNCVCFQTILGYVSSEKKLLRTFSTELISEIKQNKFLYVTTFTVFVIGLLIRAYQLDKPIRYDESFTYLEYGRSYIGYISMNYSYPNNHILHSILVRISTIILGNDLWAIRLPAFIGGIMVLVFTFFAGRKWFGLKAGILALSLVVCSEWLIGYSVNARGYSLQATLFLSVIFLALGKQKTTGRWLLIIVLNAFGFWLIPSYVFCLVVLFFLVVVKNGFQPRLLLFFILSILLSILLYLPVLAYSGVDALLNNTITQAYNSLNYLQDFYKNIASIYFKLTPGEGIVQFFIFLVFIATSFLKKTKWISIGIIVLLSLMIIILGNNIPPRVFVFMIPIAALLFSGAFSGSLNQLKPKLFIPLLLIPFVSWSIYKNKRFDYEIVLNDLPELIGDLKSKNAVGVISKIPLDYPVRYYLSKNDNLESRWNTCGTDTVYVITSEFYHQDIKTTFGEKTRGYQFSEIKKYNYSILYMGVRR